MSHQITFPWRSGTPGQRASGPLGARLTRGIRALRLAGTVFASSGQLIPLGDNSEILGRLAEQVRAARDCGA